MVRAIGAVLLLAGATGWGLNGVKRLRLRVEHLAAIGAALNLMQSEICSRLTPMPELLELLSEEMPRPLSTLFERARLGMSELGERSFAEIWSSCVYETTELQMKDYQFRVLAELGYSLGRYDIGEQRAAIAYTSERFSEFRRQAEADRGRDSRLQACIGVAAGVLAIIVLL